jgi:HEAT repeat protein
MADLQKIPIKQVIDDLLDSSTPFPARNLYRLSDLETLDLEKITSTWPKISIWRKRSLLEDISNLSEKDNLLSFKEICMVATGDEDAEIRLQAIKALQIYEDPHLIDIFINLLLDDSDENVRAESAGALGRFVYLGEIEKIDQKKLVEIEEHLLTCCKSNQPQIIRQQALESLGYSSRAEVKQLIENAYNSDKKEWVSSALFAMGRSADDYWNAHVIQLLDHKIPIIRCEAARAAGELEITESTPLLMELIDDPDEETRLVSIIALSKVGGNELRDLFENLLSDAESTQFIETLETALETLAFNNNAQLFPLFDFPDDRIDEILDDEHTIYNDFEEDED